MAGKQDKKGKKRVTGRRKNSLLAMISAVLTVLLLFGGYFYSTSEPFREAIDYIADGKLSEFLNFLDIIPPQSSIVRPTVTDGSEIAVHFIDVGQGDSALIETSAGSVLIDCGEKEYGDDVVEYLTALGIDELEYFIITHPDSDHMGSATYVLERIDVKNFVINGKIKTASFFENALDVLESKGIESAIAQYGDRFEVGDLILNILGPCIDDIEKLDSNDSSLIIYATFGANSFLFTGDAEKEGEELLLKYNANDLKCDVMSAGHHGAKTSNSLELLKAAKPTYVVVSCGKNNSYGHPTAQAMSNFSAVGATVYRTDESGSIVFIANGTDVRLK